MATNTQKRPINSFQRPLPQRHHFAQNNKKSPTIMAFWQGKIAAASHQTFPETYLSGKKYCNIWFLRSLAAVERLPEYGTRFECQYPASPNGDYFTGLGVTPATIGFLFDHEITKTGYLQFLAGLKR